MLPMTEKIGQMINKGSIMVFLNGSLEVPQCYKSKMIVKILNDQQYSFVGQQVASFDLT